MKIVQDEEAEQVRTLRQSIPAPGSGCSPLTFPETLKPVAGVNLFIATNKIHGVYI
jgi:hypothetical protein